MRVSPKTRHLVESVTAYATLTEAGQELVRRVPDPTGGLSDPETCDPFRTIVRDTRRAEANQPKPRKKRKAGSPGSTTAAPGESSAA